MKNIDLIEENRKEPVAKTVLTCRTSGKLTNPIPVDSYERQNSSVDGQNGSARG